MNSLDVGGRNALFCFSLLDAVLLGRVLNLLGSFFNTVFFGTVVLLI